MKIKNNIKYIWLAISVISIILLAFHWFGFAPQTLHYAILGLNTAALILSVPCSLFAVPVFFAANYFLELYPFSGEGIYLNTFLLFALGALQWFLIIKYWSPTEPLLQKLELVDGNVN